MGLLFLYMILCPADLPFKILGLCQTINGGIKLDTATGILDKEQRIAAL